MPDIFWNYMNEHPIYLILFVLISYYIEDKRALKIFRKMLMDENRYETEV